MEVESVEDSYPLSPMQQGMLFHSLYAPGSGVDIEQIVCALHEDLNASAFEQAWQRVIERHPVLRTSFRWQGLDQPFQDVYRHVRCRLEQQDWRALSKGQRETQLDAYLRTDRLRGFDLSQAPLIRLTLFRCAEADYQFIWTFHHALLDGRSFPLVLKEVFAFYEAYRRGQSQDLQLERPRPYRDYIDWLGHKDLSQAEAFWRRILQDFTAPTPPVVDRASERPVGGEEGRGVQQIQLPVALTSALQSLAQRHQLTLNTLVQGAWALLLSRYSGQEDVVFGATRACRRSALEGIGTESMVGAFINTLPVRIRMPPEMPVLTYLKELRAQSIAVREHEHTPLVKIQEWSDVPGGMPLFESILVFENYQLNSALRAQGGKWENREFRLFEQTNYPLTLVGYAGTTLLLKLEYDRHRFEDATISRMLGHVQTLLHGFVAAEGSPGQRLSSVPLLTEAERHQLLVEWNDTETDYPRHASISELFEVQVEQTPQAVAVVYEEEELSYSELNQRANQLAHHLQGMGVGPEVLVGICVERSLEMVVGLLGILKAGGAYVPLDPAYPKERLAFMLEDTRVPVLLTQKRLVEKLPTYEGCVLCLDTDWEAITGESEENPVSRVKADNLAYIMYTSGSIGKPKGVSIVHRGVVRLVKETNYAELTPEETLLQLAPISFDASTLEIWGCLLNGGRLVIFPAHVPSVEELAQVLQRYQVTTLWLTAGLFHQMVETQLESLRSVRQLLAGGDVLSPSHVRELLQQPRGGRLTNGYGPTENTTFTCCYPITDLDQVGTSVPIGRPIANTQVYVLDRYLNPVPIGVFGELYIGGDGLAREYWNRPELTAERFIPNPFIPEAASGPQAAGSDEPGARLFSPARPARTWGAGTLARVAEPPVPALQVQPALTASPGAGRAGGSRQGAGGGAGQAGVARGSRLYKTGDIVRYLPDGDIEFLGRIDHQVKIRGFRIELGEIEAVLAEHPAVREVVVTTWSAEHLSGDREASPQDKRLIAYFVADQEPTLALSELRSFLKEKLPDFMVPSAFVKLEAMPLTPSGKIDRRALPAPDISQRELEEGFVAPRTSTEQTLADIWAEILGVEKVGVYDNFFELGGHSLLATRVVSRLHKTLGVDMPLRSLFETPTVISLAERIEAIRWAAQGPPLSSKASDREEIAL